MATPDRDRTQRSANLFAIITLIAVLAIALGGWWLFPKLQAYLAFQDCVASGRTNCAR